VSIFAGMFAVHQPWVGLMEDLRGDGLRRKGTRRLLELAVAVPGDTDPPHGSRQVSAAS
jgi:hypothetical protein